MREPNSNAGATAGAPPYTLSSMNDDLFFPATAMPDRDWWAALWPDPLGVLRSLGLTPGMTVLDLCCGDGYFTAPLAKLVDGQAHALDLDPAMLKQAQGAVANSGSAVKGWICADARDLAEYIPEPLDYALIANTFHGVPDQTALARAVAAVLKPEGRFAVVNWHRRPRKETTVLNTPRGPRTDVRMSPESLRAVVEPGGFILDAVIDLTPYHYGAVFRAAGTG